ncbi:MAG: hypothetical protein AAFX00_06035 [Pseudomonadota bacterium]
MDESAFAPTLPAWLDLNGPYLQIVFYLVILLYFWRKHQGKPVRQAILDEWNELCAEIEGVWQFARAFLLVALVLAALIAFSYILT